MSKLLDAIRLSVLHNTHADTAGAITGAIAEAYYKEIHEHIEMEALRKLPDEFCDVMDKFYSKFIFYEVCLIQDCNSKQGNVNKPYDNSFEEWK